MRIFRAYDIRGQYGTDITDDLAYKIGRCLTRMFQAKKAVIGHDVSLNSPAIHRALIAGVTDEGCSIDDIGYAGTDVVYYSAGHFHYDFGLEVTASHSAGHLSGIKILGPGGSPFGQGFGMEALEKAVANYQATPSVKKGLVSQRDIWSAFIDGVLSFVEADAIKPIKIAVDASHSVGAVEIDQLAKRLPQIEFVKINWQLDGRFPSHAPNPFLKENREQLKSAVLSSGADLGVAFDGDADRIYFLDSNGDYIFGAYVNGLIAYKMCLAHPGQAVVHDIRAVRYITHMIKKGGGRPCLELVGHSFFKQRMRREKALFGAESSGHIYYNFGHFMAEGSLVALVQTAEIISRQGKSLSELTRGPRLEYPVSGEWNFSLPGFASTDDLTPDALKVMDDILARARGRYADARVSDFDTLTVQYPDWNFNLRPSANDPLLRFTAEAANINLLKAKQKEVLDFLREEGCRYVNDTGVEQLSD